MIHLIQYSEKCDTPRLVMFNVVQIVVFTDVRVAKQMDKSLYRSSWPETEAKAVDTREPLLIVARGPTLSSLSSCISKAPSFHAHNQM
jgi:hypothetical protein